jgi:hypothetical protein
MTFLPEYSSELRMLRIDGPRLPLKAGFNAISRPRQLPRAIS